jgi:hypothetical protein
MRGYYECYPLHCAIDGGNRYAQTEINHHAQTEIIEFLVDMYPEAVATVYVDGKLPIHLACERGGGLGTVAKLLVDCHGGSHHGLDVVDNEGSTPLYYAVTGVDADSIQHLVDRCPASVLIADRNGFLPLHALCRSN